ncbi:hypothetical protein OIU76_013762 [Salix suchowensis]|nr:hypothetical protein OIU76_013762 [Salix suchowensis]
MPQLHPSLHFHLTPIVIINDSSRRDLLLNSQNFCRSIPAGAENPSLSRLCYRRLWGSRNRRALILGWAYYLDASSSYPLRTWLPSVYRGHNNRRRRQILLLTANDDEGFVVYKQTGVKQLNQQISYHIAARKLLHLAGELIQYRLGW